MRCASRLPRRSNLHAGGRRPWRAAFGRRCWRRRARRRRACRRRDVDRRRVLPRRLRPLLRDRVAAGDRRARRRRARRLEPHRRVVRRARRSARRARPTSAASGAGRRSRPRARTSTRPSPAECANVKGNPRLAVRRRGVRDDAARRRRHLRRGHGAALPPVQRRRRPARRTTATRPARRSARRCSRRAGSPEGSGIGVIGCVPAHARRRSRSSRRGTSRQCSAAPAAASAAARTAALVTPEDALVLTLGDHAYDNGTPAEFANCFHPTWGAFKDRIRPSPGNHDYNTPGAEGYFGYFGAQAGPDRRGYYSFDYGGWHFISLNSLVDVSAQSRAVPLAQGGPRAVQRDSLCTIAYWHYPAFNSGADVRQHPADAAVLRRAVRRRRGDGAVGPRAHLRAVRAAEGRRDRGSRARRPPVRRRHRRRTS